MFSCFIVQVDSAQYHYCPLLEHADWSPRGLVSLLALKPAFLSVFLFNIIVQRFILVLVELKTTSLMILCLLFWTRHDKRLCGKTLGNQVFHRHTVFKETFE